MEDRCRFVNGDFVAGIVVFFGDGSSRGSPIRPAKKALTLPFPTGFVCKERT